MITRSNQLKRFNVRYFGALHAAVAACSTEDAAKRASELGSQAEELGIGKVDLARIHQQALRELMPSSDDLEVIERFIMRAAVFFTATIAPIGFGQAPPIQTDTEIAIAKQVLKQLRLVLAGADGINRP